MCDSDSCDIIPIDPSPGGTLHLASSVSVSHFMVEAHQLCWPQPLLISMARFLAPFQSFRLCGFLPLNFPDVPRLPRSAESEGNSFADLLTTLVQLLNLLILSFFCLFPRSFLIFLILLGSYNLLFLPTKN